MDPLTVLGLVGNIVQVVDFSYSLISKSTELYKTGKSALVGAPVIEAATVDLRLLCAKLRDDGVSSGDAQLQVLCESCQGVTDELLIALKLISADSKRQIWTSFRKALKTVMKKDQIDELDRRLGVIRQELNLRITADLREQFSHYVLEHSAQLGKLDKLSEKILGAITAQQDVFEIRNVMHIGMIAVLQRQEQYSITADQEKQLAKLPNVPQAAFNSIERQHDPICLQDTRVDVLKTIDAWVSSPDERHIFWLSGLAGTGKSTISATVAQRHGHFTVSFFFSRGGGDNGRARKLFTSVAVQLADRSPILRRYICDAIAECSNIPSLSLHDQWRYLILTPLSRLDNSFQGLSLLLVIDALDECDEELDIKAIIQLAAEARGIKTVRFRIFLTSRPEIPIRHGFYEIYHEDHKDFVLHEIPRTTIDHDINLFLVHNFKIICQERALPPEWPGDEVIRELVQKSSGLFIWAATACRFIREGKKFAKRRLSSVTKGGSSDTAPEQKLDAIYLTVLKNSISEEFDEEEKEEMYTTLREILGSLVVLYSPLTAKSLATLLNIAKVGVDDALEDLHAILDIPRANDPDRPIRIHHPSFRDFLLSKDRCKSPDFWVDETIAHSLLSHKCIGIMSTSLRTDICNLGRPGICVSEIDAQQIVHHLPEEVQYACSHWLQHLQKSSLEPADNDFIHTFLKKSFLHWFEALSLIGKISEGVSAILLFNSRISQSKCPLLYAFLYDIKRFVLANRAIIQRAPLQTYSSALIFSPEASLIRAQFKHEIPKWIARSPRTPMNWSANLQTLEGHTDWVRDLAFSPDGKMVASASADKTIRLWDTESGATLQTLEGHTEWVYGVAFCKDGTLASGSSDKTIRLWDSSSGALLQVLKGHTLGIRSVAFAPDGKVLASSAADNTLRLWNVTTGESIRTLHGHTQWVYNISFAEDGRLASASADRTVRIWDPSSGICLHIIDGYSSAIRSVAFSPDGKQVTCVTSDETVWIWDANGAEGTLHQLDGHTDWVYGVAFSPDGNLIASVSADRTVKLWNAKSKEIVETLNGHSDWIYAVAFSPDGTLLASGGADKSIRLWEVKSAASHNLKGHTTSVHAVALSPDGRILASAADDDNTMRLWDVETGMNTLILDGHSDWIYTLTFSPDGSVLASASDDKTIRTWNTGTGTVLQTLHGHEKSIRGINFSPDGKLLASASDDKTVKLWDYDLEPGRLIQTLSSHSEAARAVAFSRDSTIIATSSDDKMVKLWKYVSMTATLLVTLEGHRSTVRAVAFCPESKLLASTSADGMIRIWDIISSTTVHTLQIPDYIGSLSFCPTAPFLETNKGFLRIKNWEPGSCKAGTSVPPNLRLRGHWVTKDDANLLWLSPQYRATSSSFGNNIFGVGHSSGLVSFITFI